MRNLLVVAALAGLTATVQAATTPGTIVSAAASAAYSDSSGQPMPLQSSNTSSILVVSANPGRPVMLTVRSLFQGPSTVGKTVKLAGTLVTDTAGTWIDDGAVLMEKDQSGTVTGKKLRCKVNTLFLAQAPAPNQKVTITGISQKDTDGTRVVIPSTDTEVQTLTR